MSNHYSVLIAGDTSLGALQAHLAPLLEGRPRAYRSGIAYDVGQRRLIDNSLTGDYYDDDLGLELSRYGFEVSTVAPDGRQWAGRVFELLARETVLDLLWLTNSQVIEGERTRALAAV